MRLLVAIACTVGCDSSLTMTRSLAVGWEGKSLDGLLGPTGCNLDRATLLDRAGDRWRAARAGHERVPCADGGIELAVAPAAVVAIEVPSVLLVDGIVHARLRARAARGGELELGDAAIEWTVTGAVDTRTCRSAHAGFGLCGIGMLLGTNADQDVHGVRAGAGELRATWDGRVAVATVTVQ